MIERRAESEQHDGRLDCGERRDEVSSKLSEVVLLLKSKTRRLKADG